MIHETVLNMARSLLEATKAEQQLTSDVIKEKLDMVLSLNPAWQSQVDTNIIFKELETRFNIFMTQGTWLEDNTDHEPWLDAQKPKLNWHLWRRYREYLSSSAKLPSAVVHSIDEMTDKILMRLENPKREGPWDRRGLVVGHVQSGKTGNFIGLANKAADAGYKIIIILAGIHNNLRSQTQIRVDEGLLGYESQPLGGSQKLKTIGVGKIHNTPRLSSFTYRGEKGDFYSTRGKTIGKSEEAIILVVKKNASILKNLLSWADFLSIETGSETKRKIVKNTPLLIIDDEADQASIDTKDQPFDQDGKPDEEHNPTTINRRIRSLLRHFEKSAYVGYTATPFANIFIHENKSTKKEGDDLFPRSFIVNLPTPSNYDGPTRIFGLSEDANRQPLPLVHEVMDHWDAGSKDGWMPPGHKKNHLPRFNGRDQLSDSLQEAIQSFILSCAARESRGQVTNHKSMLIHVTRFNDIQSQVKQQVEAYFNSIQERLLRGEGAVEETVMDQLEALWENNFRVTTGECGRILEADVERDDQFPDHTFSTIQPLLGSVVQKIKILEINGKAGEVLDYEAYCKQGLYVIAVGGDKLSRGLTLEGLSVSYFLRASKMYDTLMQMGRWFGYRKGYLDLCRLYTTPEIHKWFQYITEAAEELRESFEHMATLRESPVSYGLKVKSHPVMLVTSSVKMRNRKTLDLSFSGAISETVLFKTDQETARQNFDHTDQFVRRLKKPTFDHSQRRPGGGESSWRGSILFRNVPGVEVIEFLNGYRTHKDALKVNPKLIADYIQIQNRGSELTDWTVVVISPQGDKKQVRLGDYEVNLLERAQKRAPKTEDDPFVIGRLLAPRDETIDLDLKAFQKALDETIQNRGNSTRIRSEKTPTLPSGPYIRRHRHVKNGLLLLYALYLKAGKDDNTSLNPDPDKPLIGFGISFPNSNTSRTVKYEVNNVYYEQEIGG